MVFDGVLGTPSVVLPASTFGIAVPPVAGIVSTNTTGFTDGVTNIVSVIVLQFGGVNLSHKVYCTG